MSERRAVIYVRVSTDDQAENGTSLETQELACLRRAADLACTVHQTFRDEGVSGAVYEARDGIQRALGELEAGRADTFIVHSISRLSRDIEHQQAISKRIARAGATLVVCDLPAPDTEEGDLMFGITGAFAQYERKLIRRRTMAGSRRVAEKGRQPVRAMEPYGYHIVRKAEVLAGRYAPGTEGTYVVRETQAELVRAMFHDYAVGGKSLYAIARQLTACGVPTPRAAARWSMQTVSGILKNPVYKGAAAWGRHRAMLDETRASAGKKPRYKVRRSEPTVHIPAPAIIDEATWQACQVRMASNKSLAGGNPSRTYLLSAIARCPECGRGLTGKRDHRTGRRRYRCNRDAISAHGWSVSYDAAKLEEYARRAVLAAAAAPESISAAHAAAAASCSRTGSAFGVADVTAKLKSIREREKAAAMAQVSALAAGRAIAIYEEILTEIAHERENLEAQLRGMACSDQRGVTATPLEDAAKCQDLIAALQRVLRASELSDAEKRSAVAGFVDKIVPMGADGIRVILKAPVSVDHKNKNTSQFFIGLPASSLDRLP